MSGRNGIKTKKKILALSTIHLNRGIRTENPLCSLQGPSLSPSHSNSPGVRVSGDDEAVAKKTVGYAAAVKRRQNRCNVFTKKHSKVLQLSVKLTLIIQRGIPLKIFPSLSRLFPVSSADAPPTLLYNFFPLVFL